ncbi:MAG: response regulator, partial [Leptospirales bacterium]|nr:response regulator [Leptospirales bacterium]
MSMAKILAVDDSPTVLTMVQQALTMGGHTIVVANDGAEGLSTFAANRFDLVITDINMPIMDGITLIKEIRKSNEEVPILTLTTENDESMKLKGSEAGATGWVVKPFQPASFLAMVGEVLQL